MTIEQKLKHYKKIIDQELVNLSVPDYPSGLYEPIKYSLATTGKRIRPILLLIVGEGFGATQADILPAALALEILHTYTLVHDDIMDNDDIRRGVATVHKKWNVNTAILSGDGLNTLAFRLLMDTKSDNIRKIGIEFTDGMLEICEGQALDVSFETTINVSTEQYMEMISKKTGRLIGMACKIGALTAGCSNKIIENLFLFGVKIGQAFQIQDDLLEITSSEEKMGKSLSSDFASGKKTYPLLYTLSNMSEDKKIKFLSFLKKNMYNREEVQKKFQKSGSIDKTKDLIKKLLNEAHEHLDVCPGAIKEELLGIMNFIQKRQY